MKCMEEHIRELLSSARGILLDSSALLVLHSDEYRKLLPLILGKLKAYTTMLAVMEVLTFIYYSQRAGVQDNFLDVFSRLYELIPLTPKLIVKAAQLYADCLHHNYVPEVVDLMNVSAALEENLILVSASPPSYKVYERYGIAVISVQDLVSILDKI